MKSIINICLLAIIMFAAGCSKQSSSSPNGASFDSDGGSTGQGGSLARFTIAQGHLYVVDHMELHTYSLVDPANPQHTDKVILGRNIETIYSYKDRLFIGSQDAMYIYSISDAAHPDKMGEASHVRACDPVVADDSVAYVTVRSGNTCGGTLNALYVYDVTNLLNPRERNMYTIESPWGLGMSGNTLFVCNGPNGLSAYDVTNRYNPQLERKYSDDTYYDVIPYENMLICMVEGGMLLYEMRSDGQLVKMAKISG